MSTLRKTQTVPERDMPLKNLSAIRKIALQVVRGTPTNAVSRNGFSEPSSCKIIYGKYSLLPKFDAVALIFIS